MEEHVSKEVALKSKLEEMIAFKERFEEISRVKESLGQECDTLKVEISTIKEELEKIQQTNVELKQQQQQLSESESNSDSEDEARKKFREIRRLEGLYQQMRDQFAEKSKVLDSTRRELFLAQEKCSSLQKELEEREVFGNYDVEQSLYHQLSISEAELSKQVHSFNVEISQLHNFISVLLDQSASKKR